MLFINYCKKVLTGFLFFISLFIISISCDSTEPPTNISLTLKLEDVSCTEAWLQLTTNNIQLPATINLLINNSLTQTFSLSTNDSVLYIDSLLPNQTYKLIAAMQQSNNVSNEVTVTTMDTTSHNFTWQTFEFGQHSSSTLYDVAIINENNIWAVGEIYMNDSVGNPDPNRYNAVKWNGSTWDVIRIPYNFQGTDFYNPIQSVFAFNNNDIWFCGNGVIHWNGSEFTPIPIPTNVWGPYQMNKLWGSSSNDLYAVGDAGNIAHYKNGSWTKIVSGTTTDIQDVLGFKDAFTSETSVYCAVSYVFQNGDRKILQIKSNTVDSLNWMDDKRINSIWTSNNKFFFTAGDGVFENKRGYWNQVIDLPPYYSNNIRGNDLNDVFVCGDFGLLSHFNGSSWLTYNEHYMQGILFSIATKNNIVVTVGLKGSKAIIVKGTRN